MVYFMTVSNSDNIASNCKAIAEKDLKGSSHGPIQALLTHLSGRNKENHYE
jgi:hypothetical protein